MKKTPGEHTCHHPHSPGTRSRSELLCILFELAVTRNRLHTFSKAGELHCVLQERGFPPYCMSLTEHKKHHLPVCWSYYLAPITHPAAVIAG